jgi:hypothetical protein
MITLFSDVNELYCNPFGDVNEKVYVSVANKLGQGQLVMSMDRGIVL